MSPRLIGGLTLTHDCRWDGTLSDDMTVQTGHFTGDGSEGLLFGWATWNPFVERQVVESSDP